MKKQILIADDDVAVSSFLWETLKPLDVLIDVVSTGNSAHSLLMRIKYDVVLLDLHLPGMSGESILEYMDIYNLYENANVLIITGDPDAYQQVKSHKEIKGIFLKPFEVGKLVDKIKELLKEGGK